MEKTTASPEKIAELKQVRISPRAAKNDLEVKAALVEKFLQAGHKVEINLFLKGREKYNRDWGLLKLKDFLKIIKIPTKSRWNRDLSERGLWSR